VGYAYYKELTVDSTLIGSDLTGFPAAITIASDNDLRDLLNGGSVTSASGFDIGFFSDSALMDQLPHEMIAYTDSTGAYKAWVKLDPTAAADKSIYLGYGNADITTDQSDITTTGTFSAYADSDYGHWCHMDVDPATENDQPDSTGQSNVYFPILSADAPTDPIDTAARCSQGTGVVNNCILWATNAPASAPYSLDGTVSRTAGAHSINTTGTALTLDGGSFTFTFWYKTNVADPTLNEQYLMALSNTAATDDAGCIVKYEGVNPDHIEFHADQDTGATTVYDTLLDPDTDNGWIMFTGRYDHPSTTMDFIVDGAVASTNSSWITNTDNQLIRTGSKDGQLPSRCFIDEIRFAKVSLSDDWLAAEYENQFDSTVGGANFWKTIGAETAASVANGGTMKILQRISQGSGSLENADAGTVIRTIDNLVGTAISVTVDGTVAGTGSWTTVLVEIEYSVDGGATWLAAADTIFASTTSAEVFTEITAIKGSNARIIATTLSEASLDPTLTMNIELRVM